MRADGMAGKLPCWRRITGLHVYRQYTVIWAAEVTMRPKLWYKDALAFHPKGKVQKEK